MKILSVDDSIIVRSLIKRALSELSIVELVETAASSFVAREKIESQSFDLIISDVNMPEISGIEFLESLIADNIKTPVVFFSSMSVDSIESSLKALNLGALDIVPKPEGIPEKEIFKYIQDKISPYFSLEKPTAKTVKTEIKIEADIVERISAVGIGASTGGPRAIEQFLKQITDLHIPMFISVHMPDQFIIQFAQRLNKECSFEVKVGEEGDIVSSNCCYLSHGGKSLQVERQRLEVVLKYCDRPGPGNIYPGVDPLLESIAEVYDKNALAVVLSGMGEDGLIGSRKIKAEKGTVLVQDESTCSVYGMPKAVFNAGLADGVYPITSLGMKVASLISKRRW